MREIQKGKIYKHFKGSLYQVVDIAFDSESNSDAEYKKIVVYKALSGKYLGGLWTRPYEMFASEVDHQKYPNVTQKYRFEERKREYEKEGIQVFLALKFYEGGKTKPLIDEITANLASLKMKTFVAVRDIEQYGAVQGLDMEHFMPKYAFPNLLQSDFLLIEYSESGAGLGMCAGFAHANHIPIYLIAKRGSEISTTVKSVAEKVIFYDEISDIVPVFQEMMKKDQLLLSVR
ncbi:MAG: hypothetical protein DLD55_02915 [candidate division SR1 bacterium]|nr:MAG: hypothetical protein DLD55_02915 [candidate division SR1 bacterium]